MTYQPNLNLVKIEEWPMSPEEISSIIGEIEAELQYRFPPKLREIFLEFPEGRPIPHIYENGKLDFWVRLLPLKSADLRKSTVIRLYRALILEMGILPSHFLPIANDPGGDFLYVDCSHPDGPVRYIRTDDGPGSPRTYDVGLGIGEFWESLREVDDDE